jgi:hypothetical protein
LAATVSAGAAAATAIPFAHSTTLLRGGAGNDTLIGDALLSLGESDVFIEIVAGNCGDGGFRTDSFGPGGRGGNGSAAIAGNDSIQGLDGNDLAVGDVLRDRSSGDLEIAVLAGTGESQRLAFGGQAGDRNTAQAFGDTLSGGTGADLLIGDVRSDGATGNILLRAESGTGDAGRSATYVQGIYYSGGNGGRHNLVEAFVNRLAGNQGADVLIGDLSVVTPGNDRIALIADAGSGDDATVRHAGSGGDGNESSAFNDSLAGGSGRDLLVGDMQAEGLAGTLTLAALAGRGGGGAEAGRYYYGAYRGGNGGSGNATRAFNDTLAGERDADAFIGDVDLYGGSGTVALIAAAGTGGASVVRDNLPQNGGNGGDANVVTAFCDEIGDRNYGGGSAHVLVGDARTSSFYGTVTIESQAGIQGDGEAGASAGTGTGNAVTSFNDRMYAAVVDGTGPLVCGDFFVEGGAGSLSIHIAGGLDDTISAFRDELYGSAADDVMYGDFFADNPDCAPTVSVEGDFAGRDALFADLLDGGEGMIGCSASSATMR